MCGGSRGRGVRRACPKMEKAAAFLSGSIMWALNWCVSSVVRRWWLVFVTRGAGGDDRRMPSRAHVFTLEPRESVGSNVGLAAFPLSTFPERTAHPALSAAGESRETQSQTAVGIQ